MTTLGREAFFQEVTRVRSAAFGAEPQYLLVGAAASARLRAWGAFDCDGLLLGLRWMAIRGADWQDRVTWVAGDSRVDLYLTSAPDRPAAPAAYTRTGAAKDTPGPS